jgi:hypothetical protein
LLPSARGNLKEEISVDDTSVSSVARSDSKMTHYHTEQL